MTVIPGTGVTVFVHVRSEATMRLVPGAGTVILQDEANPVAPTIYLALEDRACAERLAQLCAEAATNIPVAP